MNNIILAELLDVIWKNEIVRIYMRRKIELEGYELLCTCTPTDILESSNFIFLVDSDVRVEDVSISEDYDYGQVLDIIVRRIRK